MDTRVIIVGGDEAVRLVAAAKSAKTDHGDQFDLGAVVRAGVAFRIVDGDGRHLAAFVLQPFDDVLWITAAAGRADVPLCPLIADHAATLARRAGYRQLAFRTERRGLVERVRALGFVLVRHEGRSYYMTKEIE